ncbi:MAG: AEC family transporter [Deferrisomatales bacterium]
MLAQLVAVFFDVVAPVFGIVALGYLLGPRLRLDARTLSRVAYFVFVPAFTFHVISTSGIPLASAARLAAYITVVHLIFAMVGWGVARALGRPREIAAAFVMLSVFGNVGNFGLALIRFRLGEEALVPATIYFVVIVIVSFVVCVGVAAWTRGGKLSALGEVLRTPALLAMVPAAAVAHWNLPVPLMVSRTVGLLADAMIPTMLLALGLQLAAARELRVTGDVVLASGVRLVVAPLVAAALVVPFGLEGLDRAAGILQAGMPAAVLVSIIAMEFDVAPTFVTTAVFFSTLCSLPTLTVLLAWV